MACAARMRLRMYWAFAGISSSSAFSTARTDVMAWTVVQTPQNLCVKSHASRGSLPRRMFSIPLHIWPEAQALRTLPPSTSTSMRRWPSMRVTGPIVIRRLMAGGPPGTGLGPRNSSRARSSLHRSRGGDGGGRRRSAEDRETLDDDEVGHDLHGDEGEGDDHLRHGGEIGPSRSGPEGDQEGVGAIDGPGEHQHQRGPEERSGVHVAAPEPEDERGDQEHQELGDGQKAQGVELQEPSELA